MDINFDLTIVIYEMQQLTRSVIQPNAIKFLCFSNELCGIVDIVLDIVVLCEIYLILLITTGAIHLVIEGPQWK